MFLDYGTGFLHLFVCNIIVYAISTLQEHPELGRPWYMLHPCGTSEWMKLLLSSEVSAAQNRIPREKYLLSWFSVVGQVFGIKLHLEMLNLVDS